MHMAKYHALSSSAVDTSEYEDATFGAPVDSESTLALPSSSAVALDSPVDNLQENESEETVTDISPCDAGRPVDAQSEEPTTATLSTEPHTPEPEASRPTDATEAPAFTHNFPSTSPVDLGQLNTSTKPAEKPKQPIGNPQIARLAARKQKRRQPVDLVKQVRIKDICNSVILESAQALRSQVNEMALSRKPKAVVENHKKQLKAAQQAAQAPMVRRPAYSSLDLNLASLVSSAQNPLSRPSLEQQESMAVESAPAPAPRYVISGTLPAENTFDIPPAIASTVQVQHGRQVSIR